MFRLLDAGYRRYAAVCWACGLQRGWDTRKQAERAIVNAGAGGISSGLWTIQEYTPTASLCHGCGYPATEED